MIEIRKLMTEYHITRRDICGNRGPRAAAWQQRASIESRFPRRLMNPTTCETWSCSYGISQKKRKAATP